MPDRWPLAESEEARTPPAPEPPKVGPFDRDFWRSPLRGKWLTSFLGSAMLPLLIVCGITGFLSHAAYDPDLGSNDITGGFDSGFYFFDWPTSPAWLYSVTQGLHVLSGFAAIPILVAKLWSVIPKLFERPPVRSMANALERLSIATLVGSSIFLFATGTINITYWLPFPFAFTPAHYYAAIIFVAALALHVALKLPKIVASFRREGAFRPLGEGIEMMRAADAAEDDLAPTNPAEATISRRGLILAVGAGSAGLVGLNIGTNLLPSLRETSLLSGRGQSYGDGPNDFQVNKTFESVGIEESATGTGWRLELIGPGERMTELSRDELLAMDLREERLPIACVEGWTTYQDWTGVQLRELAGIAGFDGDATVLVESLQEAGAFRQTTLNPGQVFDERSLLALRVNGADLSLDHGFPARVIVPALPGVHNTKWVTRMTFQEA
ncbi:MAG TPA: molybdopterin-dependent oxidoreductase [Solirubrobacterales bacterium]|nr:molybdopterin-dependent oxidoreductase [Solirubrobacterales bacterium]